MADARRAYSCKNFVTYVVAWGYVETGEGCCLLYLQKFWSQMTRLSINYAKTVPEEDRKEMNSMVPVLVLWDGRQGVLRWVSFI